MAEHLPPPDAAGPDRAEAERCTVLHVDMDAFFAAVEVLDDPTLAGRPVIVGGAGARGVVASCTYEARAFGIHSAMPSVEARRRCPEAVFISGRYARYAEMSERLHDVLHRYSPVVEGIGLDEAFVDVRGARRLLGTPSEIGRLIRASVRADMAMDCAVGVGRTKLMAKLASRAAKPTPTPRGPRPGPGVVVVLPSQELAFLHPMAIRALWGVGPATARRLDNLGVHRVGDLARIPTDTLCRALGTAVGRQLAELAQGEDPRPVEANREPKSVGHEETFAADLRDQASLHRHVVRMSDAVATRMRQAHVAGRTVTVKVRFGDRTTITRSHTVGVAMDSPRALAAVAGALVEAVDVVPGVRLLGVSMSGLSGSEGVATQLRFEDAGARGEGRAEVGWGEDDGADEASEGERPEAPALPGRAGAWAEVEGAVAAIRARYGNASVGPAALVGRRGGLDVKERGDTQWGPAVESPQS